MSDINPYATITELCRGYRERKFSPADVIEAQQAREDRLEPKLHAYITRYSDEACEKARSIAQEFDAAGELPPLAGVPIALKDLIDMEGRVTSGGSPERASRVSPGTALIAQRLMSAGAIIPGKTHTVEMATGGWGTNEHLGAPWNPWDLETHRTPGGSSSGSGVAVAAGYCPGAIGTDTGGSVRLPAGWCGLVGLKVTEGTLPTEGILPLSSTLDTPGPMTRSVDDALLMFEVLKGSDPIGVGKQVAEQTGPFSAIGEPVKSMRFAVLPDEGRAEIDSEVLDAYDKSVSELANLGAEIVVKAVPKEWDGFSTLAVQMIIAYEGYRFNKEIIDDEAATMDQWVKRRLVPGRSEFDDDAYRATLEQRKSDLAEFEREFSDIDAILTPTTLTPAIPLSEVDEYGSPARFTRAANYLALCSLSVPNGFTEGGLPTSLMITCHGGQELTALRIGKAYEASQDWANRHPPGLDA
ncbi:MAG: amidase [Hyphomicrobiaceae bacterium]|nr:amidase [Hyphomicrobiaceae bacterium]